MTESSRTGYGESLDSANAPSSENLIDGTPGNDRPDGAHGASVGGAGVDLRVERPAQPFAGDVPGQRGADARMPAAQPARRLGVVGEQEVLHRVRAARAAALLVRRQPGVHPHRVRRGPRRPLRLGQDRRPGSVRSVEEGEHRPRVGRRLPATHDACHG